MIGYPKTIEEARKYRYSTGEHSTRKIPYYEGCCAYEVSAPALTVYQVSQQCLRSYGHGPRKLYCRQHAGIVEATNV